MMIRTFIALEIPSDSREKLLEVRDSSIPCNIKFNWEPIEKLHLTLKFLGNTEEENIVKISDQLEQLINLSRAFDLSFSELGVFKRDSIPKIFWVGFKENDNLTKFVLEVDNICSKFGYEKEKRKFKPHITLLRIKSLDGIQHILNLAKIKLPDISFCADKVTFFQSKLLSTGSIYTPLKEFYIIK